MEKMVVKTHRGLGASEGNWQVREGVPRCIRAAPHVPLTIAGGAIITVVPPPSPKTALSTGQPDGSSQHAYVTRYPFQPPTPIPQTLFKIFPSFRIQTRSPLTLPYLKTLLSLTSMSSPTSFCPRLCPLPTRPSSIYPTHQLFLAPGPLHRQ